MFIGCAAWGGMSVCEGGDEENYNLKHSSPVYY